jgi:hypothetical protein
MEMVKAGIRNSGHRLDWLHAKENKWKRTTLSKKYQNYCMILQTLKTIFKRDLNRLKQEIELYQNESQIWTTKRNNQFCWNLCLHVVGNLNTYIRDFGNTNYARNRELEFSLKDIPKWNWSVKLRRLVL